MPVDLVRRTSSDLIFSYDRLVEAAGFTLTSSHLDRLATALNVSTMPETVRDVTCTLLTEADLALLAEDIDPYAGQAPTPPPLGVWQQELYAALTRVCRAYGATTERTYLLLREAVTTLTDPGEESDPDTHPHGQTATTTGPGRS